jgi:hypothetical protein
MSRFQQFEHSLAQKCTAVLFALLMVGFGFVQAVHVHNAEAGQPSPATHCSLCVVAHSAALITPVSTAPTQVANAVKIAVLEPQLQSHLHATRSNIRPPPQDL